MVPWCQSRSRCYSDDQMTIVLRGAEPLHPHDHGPYLEAVAELLRGREVGDGLVVGPCAKRKGDIGSRRQKSTGSPDQLSSSNATSIRLIE